MFAVAVDAITMDTRGRAVPGGAATSPESAMASELFDQFVSAGTFKSVLATYRQLCEVLRLKPTNITSFYPRLKAKLHSWRAASLWAKLDKRSSHKCYNRGKACPNTRVLLIGAGPCGLRAAIEAQLLGAKVVVLEKRDRFSRNNVLHLWPFVIHDLRNLGAKKFFGKFCAGSIDHISIRQLQVILLKVALLLGVEVHENVGFEGLKEPPEDQTQERIGWHAHVVPSDHPVSQYEFDVLIGADGKRNTLLGFNRKEFRGKLAIAVTANFINRHTIEEARVQEISGVAFIFNQKFFQDMREQTAIDLENIVYYKDDTHYFVMTAKKQSLLERGVIINDYNDTARLLAAENVDREALMEYAKDAADFATNYQLPHLDFAVNHYGQADVAMFDFTSMYAAENACRITERKGHRLLQGLVGDSLLEPFWPTGSGCARGFLSSFDVSWMIRSWASGKTTNLQVLAEREAIYRLLAQTTPENLSKDTNQYTLNPSSRYPNLNLHAVLPSQVRSLYDTDGKVEDQILDVPVEAPKRKRRRESIIHPDALLNWCQRQVALHDKIKIENLTSSWKNGLALCAILHRYRPDLIDLGALCPDDVAINNQLAFDICEKELGIPPVMTGQEMADCEVPDKLSMVSYISQIYESFRGEIPVVCPPKSSTDERANSPNRQSIGTPRSILTKISNKLQNKRKYSIEKESTKDKEKVESLKRGRHLPLMHKRRSKDRDKGIALDLISRDVTLTNYKNTPGTAPKESINSRVKNLEEKMKRDAGLRCHISEDTENSKTAAPARSEPTESIRMIKEQLRKNGNELSAKKASNPKVGKLRKDEWNVKMLEEKIKLQQKSLQKSTGAEKSKIMQDIFDNKLRLIDAKLKAGGALTSEEQARFKKFDSSLNKLNEQLTKGNLDAGERGHNQVAAMTEHMTTIWDKKTGGKKDPLPPAPVVNMASRPEPASQIGGSEICYFCKKRVYLMERLSAEGLFFHRSCLKCEYCNSSLRRGNYSFDRDAICGGKFYCKPHFRMQKPDDRWQEMMKRKQAFLSCGFDEQEKQKMYTTILANAEKALSPNKLLTTDSKLEPSVTDSPTSVPTTANKDSPKFKGFKTPNTLKEPLNIFGRDQTPERVEYENSIMELSEEELLTSELEEEELTQKNLGPPQDLATSDDEYSDLSTDTESDEEAFAEELERSLTADETRKLAESWQRKYSAEHSLIDSDTSSSADDEGSDTEIGSEDGTSDDIDSDAEYSLENSNEDASAEKEKLEDVSPLPKTPDVKNDFIVEVPIIDLKGLNRESEEGAVSDSDMSEELTESEECSDEGTGTEVDSESEPKAVLPPPLIPTIIVEESPPQDADPDQIFPEDADIIKKDMETSIEPFSKNLITDEIVVDVALTTDSDENKKIEPILEPTNVRSAKVESEICDKSDVVDVHPTSEADLILCIPMKNVEISMPSSCDIEAKSIQSLQHNILESPQSEQTNANEERLTPEDVDLADKGGIMDKQAESSENVLSKFLSHDQNKYAVDSIAKEIVTSVLNVAQTAVLETANHSFNIPVVEMHHLEKHAQDTLSGSSSCTGDTSSVSDAAGWTILKSAKSSEDSDIPLVDMLNSPTVPVEDSSIESLVLQTIGHTEESAANDDKDSLVLTLHHSETENDKKICVSTNFQSVPNTSTADRGMLRGLTEQTEKSNSEIVDQLINTSKNNSAEMPNVLSEPSKFTESISSETIQFTKDKELVSKTNSDNSVSPNLLNQSPGVDEHYNPDFVTVRKKQNNTSHKDSFNWDSDNSISLPWYCEEKDSFNIDVGNDALQNSEEGIFRARLAQSIDGDFSEEENIFYKTADEGHPELKMNEKVCDQDVSLSLDVPKKLNTITADKENKHQVELDAITEKATPPISKSCDSFSEFFTPCVPKYNSTPAKLKDKFQNVKAVEENPILLPHSDTHHTTISEFKPFEKSHPQIEKPKQTKKELTSKYSVKDLPSPSKVQFSPDIIFKDHSTASLDLTDPPKLLNENKTTSLSSNGKEASYCSSTQSVSEEISSSAESKYRGYSGSFAEKIRPRSLFGDTIYLRSLDINLQKQQFPSLTKSTDKLDESDGEDEFKVTKKLFHSSDKSLSRQCLECKVKNDLVSSPGNKNHSNANYSSSEILNVRNLNKKISFPTQMPSVSSVKKEAVSGSANINANKVKNLCVMSSGALLPESHSDPMSPYIYAQTRPVIENAFPVKMRPKCDMDLSKLRDRREKRKSVHENIQGLPFADEEKAATPVDPPCNPEDVFYSPKLTTKSSCDSQGYSNYCLLGASMDDAEELDRYARSQRLEDQEKARNEARARARLKSDEELGLSPNNYRKKYHRQLSLNSIHYEELYSDEFYDNEHEELEDEIIAGTFRAKRVEIIEPQNECSDNEICIAARGSHSSEESIGHPSIISPSQDSNAHTSDKTPSTIYSSSNSKTDAANYLESSLSVEDIDIGGLPKTGSTLHLPCSSTPCNRTSSTDTSPDVLGPETPPFNSKMSEGFKSRPNQRTESSGDEDKAKSNGKKSFFSILNFGKGNISKEKPNKQRVKELDKERSSSLPADISSKTPPKQKPFSNLKLNRSKEKVKEKLRKKYLLPETGDVSCGSNISSENSPKEQRLEEPRSILINSNHAKIIPKYTVYRNPDTRLSAVPVHLPVHRTENGLAPKASEDSFSDTEDDNQGNRAQGNLTAPEKREKNVIEKEKKVQRVVFKVTRQQELKRLRTAQEIQRRLEELEIQQKDLEQQGVEVEKTLRGERRGIHPMMGESDLMQEWYTLIHSKNKLVREEQELLIRLKDLELEDRHSRLQQEMRERMAQSETQKDPNKIGEERKILAEMLKIVQKRDELVAMLDQLRIREEEEDKNLGSRMLAKGIELPAEKR